MEENSNLKVYTLTKRELFMLCLNNYEFCEPLSDFIEWVKFHSINEFVSKLIMTKGYNQDEFFRFNLNLDGNEGDMLREYLLKRKSFVISYILKRGSFSLYTHLYQLYLQYLPYALNEVEKNILLDGYLYMLKDSYGYSDNYMAQKRLSLEKKLNLK